MLREMVGPGRGRRVIILVILLNIVGSVLGGLNQIVVRGKSTVITVCPSGCDYTAIQDGIDNSTFGDTILISPAVYSEQLTLKSGLLLTTTTSLSETIITAPNGPLIQANTISQTQLAGLTLRGQTDMTVAIGLQSADSSLTLARVTIKQLQGLDYANPASADAVGIWVTGTGQYTLTQVSLHDLYGGSHDGIDSDGVAGDAIGIWADGDLTLTVQDSVIQNLVNGSGGDYLAGSCTPKRVIGLSAQNKVTLLVDNSEITDLTLSPACEPDPSCISGYYVADRAVGVLVEGGQLTLTNSRIADFATINDVGTLQGVSVVNASGAWLSQNVVERLPSLVGGLGVDALCPAGRYDIAGITVNQTPFVTITNNTIVDLQQPYLPVGGLTTGISVKRSTETLLANNIIANLWGGNSVVGAMGIEVDDFVTMLEVTGNFVHEINGAEAHSLWQADGGGSVGLWLTRVNTGSVTNNMVSHITGGNADQLGVLLAEGDGGDAIGMMLDAGQWSVLNNTVYLTEGGLAGIVGGELGAAVGVYWWEGDGLLANNLLVSHDYGVFWDGGVLAAFYQGWWDNDNDHNGLPYGYNDVSADPRFVDADNGDLHLTTGSPFVDVGWDGLAPAGDIDSDPRPLDGNNDTITITDIDADELWLNLSYLPIIWTDDR